MAGVQESKTSVTVISIDLNRLILSCPFNIQGAGGGGGVGGGGGGDSTNVIL